MDYSDTLFTEHYYHSMGCVPPHKRPLAFSNLREMPNTSHSLGRAAKRLKVVHSGTPSCSADNDELSSSDMDSRGSHSPYSSSSDLRQSLSNSDLLVQHDLVSSLLSAPLSPHQAFSSFLARPLPTSQSFSFPTHPGSTACESFSFNMFHQVASTSRMLAECSRLRKEHLSRQDELNSLFSVLLDTKHVKNSAFSHNHTSLTALPQSLAQTSRPTAPLFSGAMVENDLEDGEELVPPVGLIHANALDQVSRRCEVASQTDAVDEVDADDETCTTDVDLAIMIELAPRASGDFRSPMEGDIIQFLRMYSSHSGHNHGRGLQR
jgi:hypothetical protein